jgi:hypothetical protein
MNTGAEQGFNRQLASRLRPGSSIQDVKAAWGSRWTAPSAKDLGYVGLFAKLGAHVRLDVHDRVGEVGFSAGFPPKYLIEGLAVGMSLADVHAARPSLRAQDPPDPVLAGIGRTDYLETLADGCELRVAVIKGKASGIVISRPGSEYPTAGTSKPRRAYPEPAAGSAPFADPNLKLGVLASLLREGAIELGEPVELVSHLRGTTVDSDDIDYEFLEDVHDYLARYPLTTQQLEAVEELWIERGTDVIENFVWPNFDGESDELDVRSLEGVSHCPNVRDFSLATQVPVDLSPLRDLKRLESVWICENAVASNARVFLDLPSLRHLRLSGTTDLAPADTAELKRRGIDVKEI